MADCRRIGLNEAIGRLALTDVAALTVTGIGYLLAAPSGHADAVLWMILTSLAMLLALIFTTEKIIVKWDWLHVAIVGLVPAHLILVTSVSIMTVLAVGQAGMNVVWALGIAALLTCSRAFWVMAATSQSTVNHRVALLDDGDAQESAILALKGQIEANGPIDIIDVGDYTKAAYCGEIDEILVVARSHDISKFDAVKSLPLDLTLAFADPSATTGQERWIRAKGWRFETLRCHALTGYRIGLKRVLDTILAIGLLSAFAPLMIAMAVAIRLDSPGPVFFRQERTGRFQQTFKIFKFRTLFANKTDHLSLNQATLDDPRVTRVGRLLRSTSLDELPQLFNVLRGEMSLVGPRPHAPHTNVDGVSVEQLSDDYPLRHCVLPGLTGLAQINGCRGPIENSQSLHRRLAFDLAYIANWSWRYDTAILLRTVGVPFSPFLLKFPGLQRRADKPLDIGSDRQASMQRSGN